MHNTMKENLDMEQVKKELSKLLEENRELDQTLRKNFIHYGAWVCPKCGAFYGLGVTECWRCNRIDNPFCYKTFCQEVK